MTTANPALTRPAPWVRAAVLPSAAAGLLTAGVAAGVSGEPGLWGSLVGLVLVTGFFSLGQLVLSVFRSIEPTLLMVIALTTYGLQVVVLLAVYATFARHPSWDEQVSTQALGTTVLVCTMVWLTGLVWASRKERIPLFESTPAAVGSSVDAIQVFGGETR